LVDLLVAAGELLLLVAVGEVVLGESWLFIFVAHKIGSFVDSWPFVRFGFLGFQILAITRFWQFRQSGFHLSAGPAALQSAPSVKSNP
jgi:hypothetical protein